MLEETFENHQYDDLQTCPFCGELGLMPGDDLNCPHFVAAFQDGDWDDDLCPPVFCNGFRYERGELSAAIQKASGVVCRVKSGTARHPRIEAYFIVSADEAAELRQRFCKQAVDGAQCETCGNTAAVVSDAGEIICAMCGGPANV